MSEAARGFAILWSEVRQGLRPLRSLQPLLSVEMLDRAEQMPLTAGASIRVMACTGMRTGPHTYEAVALQTDGSRTTALCITLRRDRRPGSAWKVTDLGQPDRPPLPPARWAHDATTYDEDPTGQASAAATDSAQVGDSGSENRAGAADGPGPEAGLVSAGGTQVA